MNVRWNAQTSFEPSCGCFWNLSIVSLNFNKITFLCKKWDTRNVCICFSCTRSHLLNQGDVTSPGNPDSSGPASNLEGHSPEVLWKQYTTTKYSVRCRLIVASQPDVKPQRAFCYVFTSSAVRAIAFTCLSSHSEDMLYEILCKTQKINTIQAIKMHFTERLTERSSTARVFFRGISTEPLQRRAVISWSRHIHLYISRSHTYCLLRRLSSEVRAYPHLQRAICAVLCFASFF